MQNVEWLLLAIVIGICLSMLAAHALTGVPTMAAGRAEMADIVDLFRQAGLPPGAVIYDLGCGWGTQLLALAQAFPAAHIRGIELSPFPWLVAKVRTRHLSNVTVTRRNFLKADLRDARAITCYLMPGAMPKLAARLDAQIEPGTPVVALAFWFRDRQATASRNGPGLRGAAALYVWPAPRAPAI